MRAGLWKRLVIVAACALLLTVVGLQIGLTQDDGGAPAADVAPAEVVAQAFDAEAAVAEVQVAVDASFIILASILVFFMQAGFAMLEAGMIRQTGVVNSLMENFMDVAVGAIMFWAIGYGIAFGTSSGGLFGASNFFLADAISFQDGAVVYGGDGVSMFILFFFQFAFAATAGTIATGAMAERTDFLGKIIYSIVVVAIIYPVVVHWVWGGGWLAEQGFLDFAGSTVVHMVGGLIALIGAMMLGPRPGRVWGSPPKPHNLALASLGTLILWFGWYGFNPGSALAMSDNGLVGLVAVNTTLAAAAGALAAMALMYFRTGKWDLPFALNGSLGGLVGITAGCAFVAPGSSVIIGLIAGILVVLTVDVLEAMKVDDAVGAFAVHGVAGAMGTLAIGFLGQPELGANGLLMGGNADQLVTQAVGIVGAAVWVSATSVVLFFIIRAIGRLRMPAAGEAMGIDAYEHGASVWPDVLPAPGDTAEGGQRTTAPATGD
ncbi:MAG: ammonium transporter [Chloroflexi bacterium]|nr:ammonium transporter [Chloroflexota bacterium]